MSKRIVETKKSFIDFLRKIDDLIYKIGDKIL